MKAVFKVCALIGLIAVLAFSVSDAYTTGKKPSSSKKTGMCPPPTTLQGDCAFVEGVNCREDKACPGKQKCCREGCNKMCKDPLKTPELPNLDIWKKWKEEKLKSWDSWADETKQLMVQRLAELWDMASQQPQ